MPAGGVVELRLPNSEEVAIDDSFLKSSPKCAFVGTVTNKEIDCAVEADPKGIKSITWTLEDPIEALEAFQLEAEGCLRNPLST